MHGLHKIINLNMVQKIQYYDDVIDSSYKKANSNSCFLRKNLKKWEHLITNIVVTLEPFEFLHALKCIRIAIVYTIKMLKLLWTFQLPFNSTRDVLSYYVPTVNYFVQCNSRLLHAIVLCAYLHYFSRIWTCPT